MTKEDYTFFQHNGYLDLGIVLNEGEVERFNTIFFMSGGKIKNLYSCRTRSGKPPANPCPGIRACRRQS